MERPLSSSSPPHHVSVAIMMTLMLSHNIRPANATGFPGTLPSTYSTVAKSPPSSSPSLELQSLASTNSSDGTYPTESNHPSPPLKTLKKLQAMLDETDYMTTAPQRPMNEPQQNPIDPWDDAPPDNDALDQQGLTEPETEKLWTSKDRIKYKKQQERLRRVQEERRRLEHQLNQQGGSSDDDADAESGTDDGLGYSLPNLSVYLSDAEESDGVMDSEPQYQYQQQQQPQQLMRQQTNLQQPPQPPFTQLQQQQQQQQQQSNMYQPYQQQYPGNYSPYSPQQTEHMQMVPPPFMSYPPNQYMSYPPYGPYTPQQQQLMASQYSAWAAQANNMPYRNYPQRPFQPQTIAIPPPATIQNIPRAHDQEPPLQNPPNLFPDISTMPLELQMQLTNIDTPRSLAEVSASMNFDSIQKISILLVSAILLCYCAVSPRTLPLADYNMKFNENIRIVSMALIAPIITFFSVLDTRQNDINDVISTFYQSFTIGYVLAFALEILWTTLIRISVFALWEPDIFKLSPEIPSLVVPWVLRETGYMPKRITLFVADFLTTCVASPIIEEYVKFKILQWSVDLPRNFRWVVKTSSKNKRKRKIAEALPRNIGDPGVCNINSYVTQMLAASLGMKLCDAGRRILMYTKASQTNKSFYALCRGIFPIQELCGTMTALALAKRDVLGVDTPLWQMLLPAVVIHGMANFRGMKPIFKWNAATPWSEMQLSALNVADSSTLSQLASKGFAKLMWLVILCRVLGYCIKNYYLMTRQAVKRTTTYAGKHAAFSAELAATEMLKKTKDQK